MLFYNLIQNYYTSFDYAKHPNFKDMKIRFSYNKMTCFCKVYYIIELSLEISPRPNITSTKITRKVLSRKLIHNFAA